MAINHELLKQTFVLAAVRGDKFFEDFYTNFFAMSPEIEHLFDGDKASQRLKMLQTLSTIVESIYEGHGLVPYLEELGADHKGYRVKSQHYAYFGEALLTTLKQHLGGRWSAEAEQSWLEAYELVAAAMQKGAGS